MLIVIFVGYISIAIAILVAFKCRHHYRWCYVCIIAFVFVFVRAWRAQGRRRRSVLGNPGEPAREELASDWLLVRILLAQCHSR
jgi:uncharacterized membrane protein YqjE